MKMYDKEIACPYCGSHEYNDILDSDYEIDQIRGLNIWERCICSNCKEIFTIVYHTDTYTKESYK